MKKILYLHGFASSGASDLSAVGLSAMKTIHATALFFACTFQAFGWMEAWAPALKSEPVEIAPMPPEVKSRFLNAFAKGGELDCGPGTLSARYSQGGIADLNGDGQGDYIVMIPWCGNGLNADGYDAHFIVSVNGTNIWVENVIEGYGMELGDIVDVGEKTCFRHSMFHGHFEKSAHNHWVYQLFSFGADGKMRRANGDADIPFPAVTIFYEKPRFRQCELAKADLEGIETDTRPRSRIWLPLTRASRRVRRWPRVSTRPPSRIWLPPTPDP